MFVSLVDCSTVAVFAICVAVGWWVLIVVFLTLDFVCGVVVVRISLFIVVLRWVVGVACVASICLIMLFWLLLLDMI